MPLSPPLMNGNAATMPGARRNSLTLFPLDAAAEAAPRRPAAADADDPDMATEDALLPPAVSAPYDRV